MGLQVSVLGLSKLSESILSFGKTIEMPRILSMFNMHPLPGDTC